MLLIETSNYTKEMYKATGVTNCKVTHHRTAALQYAGFNGLEPYQINMLTHHMLDKQFAAYQSVGEKIVS